MGKRLNNEAEADVVSEDLKKLDRLLKQAKKKILRLPSKFLSGV